VKRQHQFVLIGSTLALAWLAMQAVHELGHVAGAAVSGGRVGYVVLHPARISYTHVEANPRPLVVAWSGPLVGVAAPLAALAIFRWAKLPGWHLLQFFAGFCLVANGAYLACGSLGEIGDAGDLLRHGAPLWLLWLFGLVTIPIGLWLWNGLGPYFGLGGRGGEASAVAAYVMLGLLVAVAGLELLLA
jgi:hypothetical protein